MVSTVVQSHSKCNIWVPWLGNSFPPCDWPFAGVSCNGERSDDDEAVSEVRDRSSVANEPWQWEELDILVQELVDIIVCSDD